MLKFHGSKGAAAASLDMCRAAATLLLVTGRDPAGWPSALLTRVECSGCHVRVPGCLPCHRGRHV
eukprot:365747-Chlamydomonas_euryale.AAC.52